MVNILFIFFAGIGKTSLLEILRQESGSSFKQRGKHGSSGSHGGGSSGGGVEHWAKRMGNKNMAKIGRGGVSMSTVGVDIGDWTFEKKPVGPFRISQGAGGFQYGSGSGIPGGFLVDQQAPNYGPLVFRTWDFGGQTEYYATHQYFLSKRSLYLVTWKVSSYDCLYSSSA